MFKNYLKVALRNLLKYKAYSFINIAGLAIGIASCILILLFIQDELSYENSVENAERVFRVHTRGRIAGNELNLAVSPAPLGEALVRDYPEVIQYTRLLPNPNMLIRYKENVFNENRFFWADSTVFELFTIPLLKGNTKTALSEPHTVVLTETLAKKYFGNEDPMDKIMTFEDGTPYTVRGIMRDSPVNSHFHYDIFGSMTSINPEQNPYFISNNFFTYIVLKNAGDASGLEKKLPEFVRKYAGPQLEQALGTSYDELGRQGNLYEFLLQPLKDIHLKSHLDYEIEPNSDIKYVYIFSTIAVFILLIACINFMNLATARSATRSKEVGVRKVLGSNKVQIIKQFLAESILLAGIAVVLAIILVEFFLPSFSSLAGKELQTNYFNNLLAVPALIITILLVGFLAGSYPAFYLSSFEPVKVLKGSSKGNKRNLLRSGLVIFQFAISVILFIGTFIVYNQLQFVQEKKLGFNKDHVLVLQRAWSLEDNAETFKQELLKNSNIVSVSNSDNLPGRLFGQTIFKPENASADKQYPLAIMSTDYDFASTLGLEISDGRYFSKEFPSDTQSVVLNESAVKYLEIDQPVGKRIILIGPTVEQSQTFTIAGVLKDFHFESLHSKIRPLCIFLNTGQTAYLPVRIRPADIRSTISFIKDQWKEFVPDKPLEYFFLDEDFNKLYQSEQKTGQIFTAFSVLAILIACLGLLGLASYTTEQRTKEIGIRKVMGANVSGIVTLISKDFIKLVLIANLIAWPVGYYLMHSWLEDFAYRVDIEFYTFLLTGLIALLISILTISFQAIKAAIANPANALKYE